MLAAFGTIGYVFYISIDRKYPKVFFICFEDGTLRTFAQRLLNDKIVVPDDLLGLALGKKTKGEDISKYPKILYKGAYHYGAAMKNGLLIPLELAYVGQTAKLNITEIGNAIDIANRYIQGIDMVNDFVKAQDPLMIGIMAVAPMAILVGVLALAIFLLQGAFSGMFTEQFTHMQTLTAQLIELTKLINATRG